MTTLTRIMTAIFMRLVSSLGAVIEINPNTCIFGILGPFLLIEKAVCSKHTFKLLVQNS